VTGHICHSRAGVPSRSAIAHALVGKTFAAGAEVIGNHEPTEKVYRFWRGPRLNTAEMTPDFRLAEIKIAWRTEGDWLLGHWQYESGKVPYDAMITGGDFPFGPGKELENLVLLTDECVGFSVHSKSGVDVHKTCLSPDGTLQALFLGPSHGVLQAHMKVVATTLLNPLMQADTYI
jgi:hypothetical protein